jgi:phosphoketolase
LREALRAHDRLSERNVASSVVYLMEPGRFRLPRDRREETIVALSPEREALFPAGATTRVFLTHMRPEPYLGAIRPLDTGHLHTRVLGYVNRGGTLDSDGMLFANRCTWAHALAAVADSSGRPLTAFLEGNEIAALHGEGDPQSLR